MSGRARARLAAAAAVALLVAAPFALKPYGIYLLSLWAVSTIAAIGLNLTLGYAGQVSLAQASFVGIGAYAAALLTTQGWPLWSAFLVALALCFVIGWVLGYPALRVQHHYLAFVTLSFSTLVFLVLRNEEWLTKGVYGISGIPRPTVLGWSTQGPIDFYFFCLGVLALTSAAAGGWSARPGAGRSPRCARTRCGRPRSAWTRAATRSWRSRSAPPSAACRGCCTRRSSSSSSRPRSRSTSRSASC